jgi:hypothetical protein
MEKQGLLAVLQQHWRTIAQVSVWLMGLLGTFILPPPTYDFVEVPVWYNFVRVTLAIIVGLILIPTSRLKERKHTLGWWVLTVVALGLALGAFFVYQHLQTAWSCRYAGSRIIIGKTMTSEAISYLEKIKKEEGRVPDDQELVENHVGATWKIWRLEELQGRQQILGILYLVSVSVFAMTIVFVLQALYCNVRPEDKPLTS